VIVLPEAQSYRLPPRLRRARPRAFRGAGRPRPRDRPPRDRGAAALSASRDPARSSARAVGRRGHGPCGGLPHVQHPHGRAAQGRRRACCSHDRLPAGAAPFSRSRGVALACSATWATRHLISRTRAATPEIPREMIATGDWVTPRIKRLKYSRSLRCSTGRTAARSAPSG